VITIYAHSLQATQKTDILCLLIIASLIFVSYHHIKKNRLKKNVDVYHDLVASLLMQGR
jgi:hypothetical protein